MLFLSSNSNASSLRDDVAVEATKYLISMSNLANLYNRTVPFIIRKGNNMSKLLSIFSILILVATNGWATHPCKPIAQACINAGYYKGGRSVGKGLIYNCFLPVVNQQKQFPDITFDNNTLQQCKMLLTEATKHHA